MSLMGNTGRLQEVEMMVRSNDVLFAAGIIATWLMVFGAVVMQTGLSLLPW